MSGFRKVIVAAGVLGIGICAAIPFYRSDDGELKAPETASEGSIRWRNNGEVRLQVQAKNDVDRTAKIQPKLESNSTPARPARVEQTKSSAAEIDMKQSPTAGLPVDLGSRAPPAPTPITHVIVDGDTLPDLAARYLGDRTRYLEIYRANPQLTSPTALPINVQIVIPPLSAESESPAATELPLD